MTMYITGIRGGSGNDEKTITGYRWSMSKGNNGTTVTVDQFFKSVVRSGETYYSYNPTTQIETPIIIEEKDNKKNLLTHPQYSRDKSRLLTNLPQV